MWQRTSTTILNPQIQESLCFRTSSTFSKKDIHTLASIFNAEPQQDRSYRLLHHCRVREAFLKLLADRIQAGITWSEALDSTQRYPSQTSPRDSFFLSYSSMAALHQHPSSPSDPCVTTGTCSFIRLLTHRSQQCEFGVPVSRTICSWFLICCSSASASTSPTDFSTTSSHCLDHDTRVNESLFTLLRNFYDSSDSSGTFSRLCAKPT